tara:strand:+ start:8057 stop:8344 length:288 start_codon:yes stop_codon:yes gene_type:complete
VGKETGQKTYKREFGFGCAFVALVTVGYVFHIIQNNPGMEHRDLVDFGKTIFTISVGACLSALGLDWVGRQSPWAKPPPPDVAPKMPDPVLDPNK